MKAIVYGEVIWDVYPESAVIGGAPFNFCAHLAHLGNEAFLISALGEDSLGEDAFAEMKKHKIHTDLVKKNANPTGKCIVTLNEKGVPSYNVLTNTSYDNIQLAEEDFSLISGDVFYFNTLIQRNEVSKNTLERILENCSFTEIFCDINLRKNCFDKSSLLLCMEKATIVKISEEEGHFLEDLDLMAKDNDHFAERVAKAFPNLRQVVYTLGENGSEVYDAKEQRLYRSGRPPHTEVVSTVGAGDCYGATYLHYVMKGCSVETAIKEATLRSNIVVSHREAIPF